MRFSISTSVALRSLVGSALMTLLALPSGLSAQPAREDHIITSQRLQQQIIQSASDRRKNIETITGFLSTPAAERAMRDAHFDPVQVHKAISALTDQELATLADRSARAQERFAAGHLTQPELALIVIALVVLIVVIIVR